MPPWRTTRSLADAQRRVGRDAGVAVRSAALQGDLQIRAAAAVSRARRVGLGQHLADERHAGLHRLPGAAHAPGCPCLRIRSVSLLLTSRLADLIHLAAEA